MVAVGIYCMIIILLYILEHVIHVAIGKYKLYICFFFFISFLFIYSLNTFISGPVLLQNVDRCVQKANGPFIG